MLKLLETDELDGANIYGQIMLIISAVLFGKENILILRGSTMLRLILQPA